MSCTYFADSMHVTNVAKMTHLKEKYQGQLCGLPNFLVSGYRVLFWR